ncbi:MAG: DnaA regulatory inactivator Hda [Gammaproteobacteria bacterium]|nr:MAG: DnaA regulatory inactivator Hda [Gammaproteobacteria bacterium]
MAQIPLPLVLGKHSRFETFVRGENDAVVAHLQALRSGSDPEILWLWGPEGSGKSHLLQATCAGITAQRVMYLPLRAAQASGAEVLQGLETLDMLALDDVDAVSGDADWDQALFGLYNRMQAERGHLIFAARRAPANTQFSLPDLASRAGGAAVYQLRPLNDERLLLALQGHANARGLDLRDAAARYLLARVSRNMGAICQWLDELDTASLVAKRKLTIPFIRAAMTERS